MKKIYGFIILGLILTQVGNAQTFDFELTGNPVDITGWNMATQSYVEDDHIVLTNPVTNQAGYIYFDQPQNLANCSQFTVTFDFRITNPSNPPADGIAFWYITNPPTNFTVGGGIGLPSNPDGLLLVLDTYNNNGVPDDNPIISLRRMTGTSNYDEGNNVGILTPDLTYQSFITDGNWHTIVLTYYFGNVTVTADGNLLMTGQTTLNLSGYFGFSAGTGASWSKHQIRNVSIVGAPEPEAPTTDMVSYCQFETPVPLTAQPTTDLLWYDSPAGGIGSEFPPVPNTDTAGVYTWYVAQKIQGCNVQSTRTPAVVVVHPQPAPPIIEDQFFCTHEQAVIQNPVTDGEIRWYENDTTSVYSTNPPGINTNNPHIENWWVSQTSAFGCESEKDTVAVEVLQAPGADFSFEIGYDCGGADTVFFLNQSNQATGYTWKFDWFGATDTVENPQFVYTQPGTYFVRLIAHNHHCSDSVIYGVEIGHPLEAAFNMSADTICTGTKILFFNQSIATNIRNQAPKYLWDFGDGNTSTELNPTHRYIVPGTYQVSLVVGNGIPCFDTVVQTIFVDPVAEVNLSASDTSICVGDKIIFTANYTQDGLVNSVWNFGDGSGILAGDATVQHAYDQAGLFTVSVNNEYRKCPNADTFVQVRVREMPKVYLGDEQEICLGGDPVFLRDNRNYNNVNASWLWNTGETTPEIKVVHPGNYKVTVTIDGCSSSESVEVNKDCYLNIPNSFTPNGDGVNDYFLPRQLLSKGVVGFRMQVFNRWGQAIFKTEQVDGRGWDGRFNGKDQPQGVYVYMIQVVYKNGRTDNYNGNVTLIR